MSGRKLILNGESGSYMKEVTMVCFHCLNCCMEVVWDMNRIASHALNQWPPKYKAGALTTEPQHLLVCHCKHSCIKSYSALTVLAVFPLMIVVCCYCIPTLWGDCYWHVLKQCKKCIVAGSECENATSHKGASLFIRFLLLWLSSDKTC